MSRCIPGGISWNVALFPPAAAVDRGRRRTPSRRLPARVPGGRSRLCAGRSSAHAYRRPVLARRRHTRRRARRTARVRALVAARRWGVERRIRGCGARPADTGCGGALRGRWPPSGGNATRARYARVADAVRPGSTLGRTSRRIYADRTGDAATAMDRFSYAASHRAAVSAAAVVGPSAAHRAATAERSSSPSPRSETFRKSASIASITGRRS